MTVDLRRFVGKTHELSIERCIIDSVQCDPTREPVRIKHPDLTYEQQQLKSQSKMNRIHSGIGRTVCGKQMKLNDIADASTHYHCSSASKSANVSLPIEVDAYETQKCHWYALVQVVFRFWICCLPAQSISVSCSGEFKWAIKLINSYDKTKSSS